jgi:hypothetical protein
VRAPAIQQAHREAMVHAESALELPLSEREFALQFQAGTREHLPLVKKLVHEFQDKLDALFAAGPKQEVFQLSLQFFSGYPL